MRNYRFIFIKTSKTTKIVFEHIYFVLSSTKKSLKQKKSVLLKKRKTQLEGFK